MWPGPYGEFGSRKYLLASLDESLARMGLDYVDIFYSHRFDPDTPLEETMGALITAVTTGRALYAGISSYSSERTRRRRRSCATWHAAADPPAVVFDAQPVDRGLVAGHAGRTRCGVHRLLAAGPGLADRPYLNGMPAESRAARERVDLGRPLTEATLEHIRALNDWRPARGQSLAQLALAWALRDERVTSVLIGASSVRQLEDNIAAVDHLDFIAESCAAIDQHAVEAGINLWGRSSDV